MMLVAPSTLSDEQYSLASTITLPVPMAWRDILSTMRRVEPTPHGDEGHGHPHYQEYPAIRLWSRFYRNASYDYEIVPVIGAQFRQFDARQCYSTIAVVPTWSRVCDNGDETSEEDRKTAAEAMHDIAEHISKIVNRRR